MVMKKATKKSSLKRAPAKKAAKAKKATKATKALSAGGGWRRLG